VVLKKSEPYSCLWKSCDELRRVHVLPGLFARFTAEAVA
jgi:hypothetical protein